MASMNSRTSGRARYPVLAFAEPTKPASTTAAAKRNLIALPEKVIQVSARHPMGPGGPRCVLHRLNEAKHNVTGRIMEVIVLTIYDRKTHPGPPMPDSSRAGRTVIAGYIRAQSRVRDSA